MQRSRFIFLPAFVVLFLVFFLFLFFTQRSELFSAWWHPQEHQRIQELSRKIKGTTDSRGFEQAIVERVLDGDTIQLADGRLVRYVGMDTPELHHPQKGEECFGEEAYEFNRQQVEGKVIQLEKATSETDHYGRLLRFIWRDDVLINKVLIENGYAFVRTISPDTQRSNEFADDQDFAHRQKLGLWRSCTVTNDHTQQLHAPPTRLFQKKK